MNHTIRAESALSSIVFSQRAEHISPRLRETGNRFFLGYTMGVPRGISASDVGITNTLPISGEPQ